MKCVAYLVTRIYYPTGNRIPLAICLNRERATLVCCEHAGQYREANPDTMFSAEKSRFVFTERDGRQVVFRVETLPLEK